MEKLQEKDRARLLEYVGKEPEMNLYFIGDIENYGLESENVSVYALPDGDEWDFVLLKYFDFYLIYSQRETFQAQAAVEFLKGRAVDCISGKTEQIRQLHPFYPQLKVREMHMCRCGAEDIKAEQDSSIGCEAAARKAGQADSASCEAADQKAGQADSASCEAADQKAGQAGFAGCETADRASACSAGVRLCRLTAENMEEILGLYGQIEEFAENYKDMDKARERKQADFACGEIMTGVYEGNRLAAVAATSASNSLSAMVVGVAALPELRGRGYASAAVRELCRQSFSDGREFLCLFYDNPVAGRIYHRIGFREIGSYAMMR